ncbi:MAG: hypothetical protein D6693_04280 [Planctomycetota bacterium]|nr:MAG: hypothetical protein D6693_04280 [Planctomycetota bacterium]
MARNTLTRAAVLGAAIVATPALAAFDPGMHQVADLAPFTNLVATLDMNATPFAAGAAFTQSGFVRSAGGAILDATTLTTRVYRVTQATSVGQGGPALAEGDLVFAYSLRLVSQSAATVQSLLTFEVGGLSFIPGSDVMDASIVRGRGLLTPGPGVVAPGAGDPGDLEDLGAFGASHDWRWSLDPAQQLDNGQAVTLLMFTGPAAIGAGYANLIAPPTQPGVNPVLNGAPVLIPTAVVPAPGAVGVLGLAGLAALRRRR